MNPLRDFLMFNPDAIINISFPALQIIVGVIFVVHSLLWGLVLLLLPIKLLLWILKLNK